MEKKLELKDIQRIEIEILSKIDEICKENNLSYSLTSGSLLGAVRHKNFIPWDDDMDIMMMRKDYEKLKQIMTSNEYKDIKYLTCDKQEDYWWPYDKIVSLKTDAKEIGIKPTKDYGVFVDIFPIDNLPNNEKERKRYIKKIVFLRKIYLLKFFENSLFGNKFKIYIKKILLFFLKPVSLRYILLKLVKLSKKYENIENCKFVDFLFFDVNVMNKVILPIDYFDKKITMDFDDKKFMIIQNYDDFLKKLYGNYMKLPPKDKQVSNHSFEILRWK